MSSKLAVGDRAPQFRLPDAEGREVSLSDYAGQRVIVYFYPAAMTPGCTIEAVDFSDTRDEWLEAGYQVVGISPDGVDKLRRFSEHDDLKVLLLADPAKEVIGAYGAYGVKKLYGKEIEGVIRSTFVIDVDTEGVGTVSLAQYNVRAKGHVSKLKRDLGLL